MTPTPVQIKKRVVLPLLLLGLALGIGARAVLRGTVTHDAPTDPREAGTVTCSLLASPDGGKPVRCAILLDRPVEQVRDVLVDYPHYTDIFPYLSELSAKQEADGRYRLKGVAASPVLHAWPFEILLTREERPDGLRIAWDEPGGKLARNRGDWTLVRAGAGRTLAAYTLDIQIVHYPGFLVRDVLMDRMPAVLQAVRKRLQ